MTPVEPIVLYFGEPWGTTIFASGLARQVDTPVGEECWYCETEIADGDDGIMQTTTERFEGVVSGWRIKPRPIHKECQLRSVLGGMHDLTGRCQYSGHCHELREAEGVSIRQDAIAVWKWVQEHPRQLRGEV